MFYVDILKLQSKTKFPYIGSKKFKARFNSLIMRDHFVRWVYNYLIEATSYLIRLIQIKLFQNFPRIFKNWGSYQVDFHLRRINVLLRFWFYLYGTF